MHEPDPSGGGPRAAGPAVDRSGRKGAPGPGSGLMPRLGPLGHLARIRITIGWRLVGRSARNGERLAAAKAYRSAAAIAELTRGPFAGDVVALPTGRDTMAEAAATLEALGDPVAAAMIHELLERG